MFSAGRIIPLLEYPFLPEIKRRRRNVILLVEDIICQMG